jgi:hypothetical protein
MQRREQRNEKQPCQGASQGHKGGTVELDDKSYSDKRRRDIRSKPEDRITQTECARNGFLKHRDPRGKHFDGKAAEESCDDAADALAAAFRAAIRFRFRRYRLGLALWFNTMLGENR